MNTENEENEFMEQLVGEYENVTEEDFAIYEEDAVISTEQLPKLAREFVKTALQVSHQNETPAAVSFFVLLGQICKDFVHVGSGMNTEDTRVHFTWIQTSGTGKSTLWNFVGPVAERVHDKINNGPRHPNMVWKDHNLPTLFNTFSLTDYTDSVLIGKFSKDMGEDGEEWTRIPGQLEGSGLAHWDEFEYSGVFKPTSHNEKSIVYLNTLMNTLAGESWVITKALSSFDNQVMHCFSQRSVIAMTYPPENLTEVIANKGVLQRMLLFVKEVPEHEQHRMRLEQLSKAGTFEVVNQPIEEFASKFYAIYTLLRNHFEANGRNPQKTVTYADSFNDALIFEYENLAAYINNTSPHVRAVAQNFTTRLMKILMKMSVLCSIAEAPQIKDESKRFIVTGKNVRQSAHIVRQCYSTLVAWLEQGLKVKRSAIAEKSLFSVFVKVYGELPKDENGFVPKNDLLNGVMKSGKKSQASVYNYFRKIQNKFEMDKQGRSVFIRLIGDEE